MSDFKGGGIKTTDYDGYNTKYITQKTEFTDDVYVFGKLYADLGGDVQTFSTAGVERVRIDKEGKVNINGGDFFIKGNHKIDINDNALELRGNNGGNGFITNTVGNLNISTLDTGSDINIYSADKFSVYTNNTQERLIVDSSGQVLPALDNSYNLGSSTNRWANIYSADLQLSNVGSGGNEVDGTEGNWTLQEAENDIFLINRKNGKRFKIKMEEV